ncbi:hypothetical protein [Chlamydiifrater volucris]|uniref:hypothetical protein n=1 Tax=Chlamydiifrater volucris TaxID=2681470 RepID=UPI001BD0B733|nr:hypothetical protein [Chlamydiifrater volucris]
MTTPIDSSCSGTFCSFPLSTSLEEKIKSNLIALRTITLQRIYKTEEIRSLSENLFSIRRQGFGPRTISEALAISNISLNLLLQTNQTLSESQYTRILSNCKDLKESSGSSHEAIQTPTLTSTSAQEEHHLPLKKRKKTLEEFVKIIEPSSAPELRETEKSARLLTIDTQQVETTARTHEQSSSALVFLLETIIRDHPQSNKRPSLRAIQCPETNGEELYHSCSKCALTRKIFVSLSYTLRKQLAVLSEASSKEVVAEALLNLPFVESLENLSSRHHFTHLEIAHIIARCNIKDENICIPGRRNPATQIPLYNSLERVISSGLSHPLTQTILNIWQHSPVVARSFYEESASLLIVKDNEPQLVCTANIESLFSNIDQRYFHKGRSKRYHTSMSQGYKTFLATIALLTLYILKNSPLGIPYLTNTAEGTAVPWHVIDHLVCLILCSNPAWKVAVSATRASIGPSQELGFSDQEAETISRHLLRFTTANGLFLRGQSVYNASS